MLLQQFMVSEQLDGVILVTTKRGGEQKPTITYSGSIALQEATVLPDYVDSYEWRRCITNAGLPSIHG